MFLAKPEALDTRQEKLAGPALKSDLNLLFAHLQVTRLS